MRPEVSSSPGRMTFQKEKYLERCMKDNENPSEDYLDMFDQSLKSYDSRFDNPESRQNSMEYDLLTTDWILEKVRASESYAQNLYAAMCNNSFVNCKFQDTPEGIVDALKNNGKEWSCSWRYAGGIIADMCEEGDYIDWYCSGIRDNKEPSEEEWATWSKEQQTNYTEIYSKYVSESVVTDEIRADLLKLGWKVIEEE
jgi:hypothetical protein